MTISSLPDFFNGLTTYNPFEICDKYNINVVNDPLGSVMGYYYLLRGYQFIFVSSNLSEHLRMLVCAHELGHALLHPEVNAYYSLFPVGRYERQANSFAVNLRLMDARQDHPDYDLYQLACVAGIPKALLESAFESIVVA